MVASGLERVFGVGCAYRAEKHETVRQVKPFEVDVEHQESADLLHLHQGLRGLQLEAFFNIPAAS